MRFILNMKHKKAHSGQEGYCEFNKNNNFNSNEKPAKIVIGRGANGEAIIIHKSIGDSRTVECYKFQHKQAKRKGLKNLKALKKFLKSLKEADYEA